ncbi:hypothetical protein [Franconibacter helveticus]|uniref:hypothetical protein n=1 Tax=Franconibacter helveticus TaxID=357240 RepID=UPI00128B327A|nr:hypothetical protein [Franconibacter helveticus]
MAVRSHFFSLKRECQPYGSRSREHEHKNNPTGEIPEQWELTEQQQAFIALFTEQDHKKH